MSVEGKDLSTNSLWKNKGVDIWLIRENLKLSYEERIAQHQEIIEFIEELQNMGRENRAKASHSPKITHSQST